MKTCIIGHDSNAESLKVLIEGLRQSVSESVIIINVDDNKLMNHMSELEQATVFSDFTEALSCHNQSIIFINYLNKDCYQLALYVLQHGCNLLMNASSILNSDNYHTLEQIAINNNCSMKVIHKYHNNYKLNKFIKRIINERNNKEVNVKVTINHDINKTDLVKYISPNTLSSEYDYSGGIFHDDIVNALFILLGIIGQVSDVTVREESSGVLPQNITDNLTVICTGEHGIGEIHVRYSHDKDDFLITSNLGETTKILKFTNPHDNESKFSKLSLKSVFSRLIYNQNQKITKCTSNNKILSDLNNGMDSDYVRITDAIYPLVEKIWPLLKNIKLDFTPLIPDYKNKYNEAPRVLVTGSTGMLGKELCAHLLIKNFKVRALVRKLSSISNMPGNIELFYGDVADMISLDQAFNNIDYVVHAAADTIATNIYDDVTTITGTKNIVELCKKYSIKNLIYISTCNVYASANYESGYKVDENSPLENAPELRGSYTYTKLGAESIIQNEIASGNINAISIRPGTYLSQNGEYLSPMIGFSFNKRLFITIGHRDQVLPIVCIENVVSAIIYLLENGVGDGNTYNLIDSDTVTKEQYIETFIKKLYTKSIWIHIPYHLMYFTIAVQEYITKMLGVTPIITRYRFKASQNNIIYSSDKIRTKSAWSPPCKLRDVMRRIVDRANLKERKGITT